MSVNKQQSIPWHHQSVSDVQTALSSSQDGLSQEVATQRQDEYGQNTLPSKPPRPAWKIFLSQFSGPLMVILMSAAGISGVLQEWLDLTVILIAVLVNVILGFVEEYKADQSLQKLKQFLPKQVRVRRDGEVRTMDARFVVPGDIMLLAMGDKVTADGRIVSAQQFEMNEASLTGESTPVKKQTQPVELGAQPADQKSMVFAGTVVVHGRAEVAVTGTGLRTEIGRITQLVSETEDEKTPLQQQLARLGRWLSVGILLFVAIIFVSGLLRGFEALEMLKVGVAVAVAAIPEGLAVGTTVILAIGMQRILKRQALVRRLIAAETLGSVSVICADKTGTLTTGVMTVDEIRLNESPVDLRGSSHELDALRRAIFLTHAAQQERDPQTGEMTFIGTPTESALARYVYPFSEGLRSKADHFLAEIPFDSEIKFSARSFVTKDGVELYAMGAPDVLLERSDITDARREVLTGVLNEMTRDGLRVLLVTKATGLSKTTELTPADAKDLTVLGFVGLRDPLRERATETVRLAKQAGLRPVMITGDHPQTARVIAAQVGLDVTRNGMLTGPQLDEINDEQLLSRIEQIHVYARVMPKHKLRIVKAWQRRGHAVAMTGDGVNDAPAIKAADIGIAFGSGTEVAKETADMVLLDNNFRTIVMAIREGRIIFDNIRKLIVYLLASSFSEIILVMGAVIFALPLPILPAQILWINLITDGFPAIALTFEPGERGVMAEKPRRKGAPILNLEMNVLIFIIGLVTDAVLFGIYFFLLGQGLPIDEIRTFIFASLGLSSLMYVFAIRKFRSSIFQSSPFENKYLIAGVALGLVLQFMPVLVEPLRELFEFTVLSPLEWVALGGLATLKLILIELVKGVFNKLRRKKEALIVSANAL